MKYHKFASGSMLLGILKVNNFAARPTNFNVVSHMAKRSA
jgi:hypothetical protein